MPPLAPSILTANAQLFQASLTLLRQPHIAHVPGLGPTDAAPANDLLCLYGVAAIQACAKRPATESAWQSILQDFAADLQQIGQPLDQAQPADVALYLPKWAQRKGTYKIGSLRYVAPTTMQQRISHLKVMLARFPSFYGPSNWQPNGTGNNPGLHDDALHFPLL
jgi:hypothetical protein